MKNNLIIDLLDQLEIKISISPNIFSPLLLCCNVETANEIAGMVAKRPGDRFMVRDSIELFIDQEMPYGSFCLKMSLNTFEYIKHNTCNEKEIEILNIIKKINSLSS